MKKKGNTTMILEKEKNWWQDAAVYQIYPKSFYDSNGDGYGDIEGIRQKLPYINNLGVEVIWVCPFFKSPQADNGYDISDYFSVDERFGTMEDLRRLIDDCHAMGLKFVLDLVANHTSDEHPWFKKALSGDEKYMYYFYFRTRWTAMSPQTGPACSAAVPGNMCPVWTNIICTCSIKNSRT